MVETDSERDARRMLEDERYVVERLQREAALAVQFPWSHKHGAGMLLWQLGYGKPEVLLALYRLRKKGVTVYDKRMRRWRLR